MLTMASSKRSKKWNRAPFSREERFSLTEITQKYQLCEKKSETFLLKLLHNAEKRWDPLGSLNDFSEVKTENRRGALGEINCSEKNIVAKNLNLATLCYFLALLMFLISGLRCEMP